MKKLPSLKYTAILRDGLLILMGSILYALSTVLLIFPNQLLLGGTSGISVILENLLPFSPGTILVIINSLLVILAFIILGKNMAVKTLIGSVLTTVFVGLFERLFMPANPPISNPFIASVVGAAVIAIASGIMFYADSSSGGTDIIALIVRKFIHIDIGKALLITDILIVIIGGALSGLVILISSFIGLLIKTLGIDLVISTIQRFSKKRGEK
ncbi:MAG: YitT family protein [Oscillospiraceae bacterium]|nr:YitT family protein [Oscillospiraceae bacterium]